jgi:hypothetical protein
LEHGLRVYAIENEPLASGGFSFIIIAAHFSDNGRG